jgi:hypothetical protein
MPASAQNSVLSAEIHRGGKEKALGPLPKWREFYNETGKKKAEKRKFSFYL